MSKPKKGKRFRYRLETVLKVRDIKKKQEEEALSVANFEKQIVNTISTGAGDRKTAIKWILQGEGLDKERDPGYVCYCLNLPYSFENEFKPVLA